MSLNKDEIPLTDEQEVSELKRFTYVATLEFYAFDEGDANQMLQDYLEDMVSTGLEYPDSWALDPFCEDKDDEDD